MKKIAIVGAGPAGIEAAAILAKNGHEVQLFEKSSTTLSNILDKAYLFPDFSRAQDLADKLNAKLLNDKIHVTCDTEIVDIRKENGEFKLVDKEGKTYIADSVLITTGYTLFDAHRKEEMDEKRRQTRTEQMPEEIPSKEKSPEQLSVDRDSSFRIHMALHALEEPYREAFELRVFGELSFREIGTIFGKTENWARVTYHRARLKLQERMNEDEN